MLKTKIKKGILFGVIGLLLIFSFPLNTYASDITRDGVVNLINTEREVRGINTLTFNSRLQTAAQWKADDMIQKDYWEHFHNGKSPWDWIKEAGYDYIDAGENLAIDFTELEPMHQAWMNSPTHRDNIVNYKYKEVGVGIAKGDFEGHQTIIVVQMFGNPVPSQVAQKEERNKASASFTPIPTEKQFTAQADENLSKKETAKAENKPQGSYIQRSLSFIKNSLAYIFNGYKTNVQKGYAQFRSIILRNYSASANN
ncbi:MAG: CAP domain-containing protein [Candidatus Berkelbacteria bacterium]|nr:CAP domain-containing protein [Candidatus Berkelbacteria bacterium]